MDMDSPVAFFDKFAPHYDSSAQELGWVVPYRLYRAIRPYIDANVKSILDVGIGTGKTSEQFRRRHNVTITGVDISSPMLELCRRKNAADHLHVCDIQSHSLPFASQTFDLTIAGGVLDILPNIRPAIHEMARVTRPGFIVGFSYRPTEGPHMDSISESMGHALEYHVHSTSHVKQIFSHLGLEELFHSRPFAGYYACGPHMYSIAVGRVPVPKPGS